MELMNPTNDESNIIAEKEDRISQLPEDVIHHILSFIDMKHAVQTSILSRKWKPIWTSVSCLNISIRMFRTMTKYAEFVRHVLSHRNNQIEISATTFEFYGETTEFVVENIVNYVYLHNVRQLTMIWYTDWGSYISQRLFSSHTLKHLTLRGNTRVPIPVSAWDFPALETLDMSYMLFGDSNSKSIDLFSKCVNLKDLTIRWFYMGELETFNICAPKLSNLSITSAWLYPKILNVVAPQLKNLTMSIGHRTDSLYNSLQLSTEGFDSLEKVNLNMSNSTNPRGISVPSLLMLFKKLSNARYLILSVDVIKAISSHLKHISLEPCPFNNLTCLKMVKELFGSALISTKATDQVIKYFRENSQSATFITDIPPEMASSSTVAPLRRKNKHIKPSKRSRKNT